MKTTCPGSAELLALALGGGDPSDAVAHHVGHCVSCRHEVEQLLGVADALRAAPPPHDAAAPGACLDETAIAALIDHVDPERDRTALAHLASCGRCRMQLADTARLVRDPSVALEIERVEPARRRTPGVARAAVALVAASLAGLLLWPRIVNDRGNAASDGAIMRERAITTTAAPSIAGPIGPAGPADSLRWTSVPRADLYRITIWNREGTVVWEGRTRDTVMALPDTLARMRGVPLLWDVKARTGWDRWVASDLVEFTVRGAEGAR